MALFDSTTRFPFERLQQQLYRRVLDSRLFLVVCTIVQSSIHSEMMMMMMMDPMDQFHLRLGILSVLG